MSAMEASYRFAAAGWVTMRSVNNFLRSCCAPALHRTVTPLTPFEHIRHETRHIGVRFV